MWIAAAGLLCGTAHGGAIEVSWTRNGDGLFQAGANWSTGTVPGGAQTAVFELPLVNTVSFSASAFGAGLVARGAAQPTLELGGRSYALSAIASVVVGEFAGDASVLTVTGGALSGLNVEVGKGDGAAGTLAIAGGGSVIAALDVFVPRGEGSGGALAALAGSSLSARTLYLAYEDDSVAAAAVSGVGAVVDCEQDLVVGQFGVATADVTGGGAVFARDIAAGRSSASSGTLRASGAGSEVFALFKLSMGSGFGAEGRLEVENGARARSFFGVLAEIQSSRGDADVAGAGSVWEVEDALYVGFRGRSTLRIADGALVSSGFSVIGRYPGSKGEAILQGAGARWVNEGQIDVGGESEGLLAVGAGAIVRSARVNVSARGALGGDGLIEAAVSVRGVHRPGPMVGGAGMPGVGAVAGSYELGAEGTLEIDVAGDAPGAGHDVLVVAGEAALGGRLRIVSPSGFDPTLGSELAILHAGALTGWFTSVEAPALAWPKRYFVERRGESVVLRVGVRRFSEFGWLDPETDAAVRGSAGEGARMVGKVREWAAALLEVEHRGGRGQPQP